MYPGLHVKINEEIAARCSLQTSWQPQNLAFKTEVLIDCTNNLLLFAMKREKHAAKVQTKIKLTNLMNLNFCQFVICFNNGYDTIQSLFANQRPTGGLT